MKYVSIDIETTGLDPEQHNILSIGLIIEDTNNLKSFEEIPKLHILINQDNITGSLYALSMNSDIIKQMSEFKELNKQERLELTKEKNVHFLRERDAVKKMYEFFYANGLCKNEHLDGGYNFYYQNGEKYKVPVFNRELEPITINVAGKNFGTFDKLFLSKMELFTKLIKIRQRIIDPSILFVDWHNDETLPSLHHCKLKCSFEDSEVKHDALMDAWDVINILRTKY